MGHREQLSGLWAFPLTPFDRDGAIALRTLGELVERQIGGGVDAIVSLGIIAEVESLSPAEWLQLAVALGDVVDGRCPHLLTLPPGGAAALAAAEHASAARADAVVYVPSATDVEALPATVAELGDRARVPVIVYQRGQVRLPIAALEADRGHRLARRPEGRDLRRAALPPDRGRPPRPPGARRRVGGRRPGVRAVRRRRVLSASNAHDPAYSRAWYERLRVGDVEGAHALLEAFGHPFSDLRLQRPGIDVDVVKEALRARGLDAGGVRPPGVAATAGERARARALLDQLDAALSGVAAG